MTCPCLSPSGHVLQRLERTCSPFQSKVRATSVPSRCTLSSDSSTIRKRICCQMCRLCYVLALYLLLGVSLHCKVVYQTNLSITLQSLYFFARQGHIGGSSCIIHARIHAGNVSQNFQELIHSWNFCSVDTKKSSQQRLMPNSIS